MFYLLYRNTIFILVSRNFGTLQKKVTYETLGGGINNHNYKVVVEVKPSDVACHNDYLSENFMDDGEKIWIIDWEYGGYGDPYFDLGDFAVEHPFSREQEE